MAKGQTMTARITAVCVGSMFLAQGTLAAQPETDEPEPTPENCPSACCFCSCGGVSVCDIFDFLFFQQDWIAGDPCAIDMDTSTGVGVGDIFDFLAFQQEFLSGVFIGC